MKSMNKIVIPLKGIPTLNEHDNENQLERLKKLREEQEQAND